MSSLTTKDRTIARDKLGKEISKERLRRQRCCLVEEQPTRSQKHVVGVPRLSTVEEGVACVERPAGCWIVGRIQGIDLVEDVRGKGGIVKNELPDEEIECLVFCHARMGDVEQGLAKDRPFVQLSRMN